MSPGKLLLPLLLLLLLTGCVSLPKGPAVTTAPPPGKPFNVFNTEFEKCRGAADRQIGSYYDYSSSQEAQFYYDDVFVRCMIAYGNQVQQPVRIYPAPPPGYYVVPQPGAPLPDNDY